MDITHDEAAPGALYPRTETNTRRARVPIGVLLVQFVLGGLGGGAFAAFAMDRAESLGWAWLGAAVVLFVLLLWLQIIVHEAGHAIAGVATGRRLLAAGIGPLRLERGTGGWQMRWGGRVRGIGGFAALIPVDGRGEKRRDEALFLLGGPLANLLVALAAFAALRIATPESVLASIALGATVLSGAMLGLINLLPFESQGWRTDGRGLLDLARNAPVGRVARLQQRIVSLSLAGVRPRDWPPELLDLPDGVPKHLARGTHLLRLGRALDTCDRPSANRAARALAELYPTTPDGHRQTVALMLAIYAVEGLHDARMLSAWRPLCEGGLLDLSPYRLWLDAEAASFAGDVTTARTLAARARESLPGVHDPASAQVLAERIERLDARLLDTLHGDTVPCSL